MIPPEIPPESLARIAARTAGLRERLDVVDGLRERLDEVVVSTLVEYLADRLGIVDGELRLTVKSGRYDRGRGLVPLDRLR